MKITWAKVEPGMTVELNGKPWVVESIEHDGKRATVSVRSSLGRFTREVKLKTEVDIARAKAPAKPKSRPEPKLHRDNGKGLVQTRWASEVEASAVLEPGDPEQAKPPRKAKGSPWTTPTDEVEQRVADLLSAHLVAESSDTAAGYYVPPQDITTIKAHALIFHADADLTVPEADLLAAHAEWHAKARAGEVVLKVNHWHTERRP